jgi:hypothetical protein
MGKQKLIKNLAGLLAIKWQEDGNFQETVRMYLTGGGVTVAEKAKQLDTSQTTALATRIYNEYHQKFPEIRQLQQKIDTALRQRGWIKNFYGRVYQFEGDVGRHKAVNYLIQGSAADCAKLQSLRLHEELLGKYPFKVWTQVHDSLIMALPKDVYKDFIYEATTILQTTDFRAPMLVDCKIARGYLSQATEIPVRMGVVPREEYSKAIDKSLEDSVHTIKRVWGGH